MTSEINLERIAEDKKYLEQIKEDEDKLISFFSQTIAEIEARSLRHSRYRPGSEYFLKEYYISTFPAYEKTKLLIIPKKKIKEEVRNFLTFRHETLELASGRSSDSYDFAEWLHEGAIYDFVY